MAILAYFAVYISNDVSSLQVKLPGVSVGRYRHAIAAVGNGIRVCVVGFGGFNATTMLAATTVMKMSEL